MEFVLQVQMTMKTLPLTILMAPIITRYFFGQEKSETPLERSGISLQLNMFPGRLSAQREICFYFLVMLVRLAEGHR